MQGRAGGFNEPVQRFAQEAIKKVVKDQILRRGVPKSPSNTCATPLRLFGKAEYKVYDLFVMIFFLERAGGAPAERLPPRIHLNRRPLNRQLIGENRGPSIS